MDEQQNGTIFAKAKPLQKSHIDRWFNEAVEAKVAEEPNQMAIASVDEHGRPSVRMVLLKGYDQRGFIFYTNYDSRKGHQLTQNGYAAICMYWEPLQRQVCEIRMLTTLEMLGSSSDMLSLFRMKMF